MAIDAPMADFPHLIEDLAFEVAIEPSACVLAEQERVAAFAQGRALQVIAEIFDAAAAAGITLRLERLEIDLGPIASEAFESSSEARLRQQLAQALADARREPPAPPASSLDPRRRQALDPCRREALGHFLQRGRLPWTEPIASDPVALAWAVLRDDPAALLEALRPLAASPAVARRLAEQLPPAWLQALLHELPATPARAAALALLAAPQPAPDRLAAQLQQALRDDHGNPHAGTASGRNEAGIDGEPAAGRPPDALQIERTRLESGLALTQPEDAMGHGDTASAAQAARTLLRLDRPWLRQALAQHGRSARVRRRLAESWPEDLLAELLGLWLAPPERAEVRMALARAPSPTPAQAETAAARANIGRPAAASRRQAWALALRRLWVGPPAAGFDVQAFSVDLSRAQPMQSPASELPGLPAARIASGAALPTPLPQAPLADAEGDRSGDRSLLALRAAANLDAALGAPPKRAAPAATEMAADSGSGETALSLRRARLVSALSGSSSGNTLRDDWGALQQADPAGLRALLVAQAARPAARRLLALRFGEPEWLQVLELLMGSAEARPLGAALRMLAASAAAAINGDAATAARGRPAVPVDPIEIVLRERLLASLAGPDAPPGPQALAALLQHAAWLAGCPPSALAQGVLALKDLPRLPASRAGAAHAIPAPPAAAGAHGAAERAPDAPASARASHVAGEPPEAHDIRRPPPEGVEQSVSAAAARAAAGGAAAAAAPATLPRDLDPASVAAALAWLQQAARAVAAAAADAPAPPAGRRTDAAWAAERAGLAQQQAEPTPGSGSASGQPGRGDRWAPPAPAPARSIARAELLASAAQPVLRRRLALGADRATLARWLAGWFDAESVALLVELVFRPPAGWNEPGYPPLDAALACEWCLLALSQAGTAPVETRWLLGRIVQALAVHQGRSPQALWQALRLAPGPAGAAGSGADQAGRIGPMTSISSISAIEPPALPGSMAVPTAGDPPQLSLLRVRLAAALATLPVPTTGASAAAADELALQARPDPGWHADWARLLREDPGGLRALLASLGASAVRRRALASAFPPSMGSELLRLLAGTADAALIDAAIGWLASAASAASATGTRGGSARQALELALRAHALGLLIWQPDVDAQTAFDALMRHASWLAGTPPQKLAQAGLATGIGTGRLAESGLARLALAWVTDGQRHGQGNDREGAAAGGGPAASAIATPGGSDPEEAAAPAALAAATAAAQADSAPALGPLRSFLRDTQLPSPALREALRGLLQAVAPPGPCGQIGRSGQTGHSENSAPTAPEGLGPLGNARGGLTAAPDSAALRRELLLELESPAAAPRLLSLVDSAELAALLVGLRPPDNAELAALLGTLAAVQAAVPLPAPAPSAIADDTHTADARVADRFLLRELVEEGRVLDPPGLVRRWAAALSARLPTEQAQAWRRALVAALEDRAASSTPPAVAAPAATAGMPVHDQPVAEPANRPDGPWTSNEAEHAVTNAAIDAPIHAGPNAADGRLARRLAQALAQADPEPGPERERPGRAGAMPHPGPAPSPWPAADDERPGDPATLEDGALYVTNAGLVLVAPFLPRLFERLGLCSGRAFVDRAAAERAVLLTQYLATGAAEAPESLLLLNKLLCGLPLAAPVPRDAGLGEAERTAADEMLRALIAHWGALGKTSVAGLRESFLQRTARLTRRDNAWHLRVEARAFDMLLDRLPWGYATLRLAWMKEVLHVDWR